MGDAWAAVTGAERRTLADLFKAEPDRLSRFTVEEAGIRFDFAKTHLDQGLLDGFAALAEAQNLTGARDALFSGEKINVTEGRAAEHTAERGQGAPESVQRAQMLHSRMRALIDAIEAGAFGDIAHVLHIGIGGSALGPEFLIDALGRDAGRYDMAVVSNVDGAALEEALSRFDPTATLIVIASKTFTTSETMLNANSALDWLEEGGVDDPYGRVIALTASPEKAIEFGIDETRILPFSETVGGRYSLWSSIGFPVALALGWGGFEELLEGAAAMDRHFRLAPTLRNAPVLAAFVDRYYANVRGAETRGVFAYDERLRLLPSYLQQLEMESNGKSVTIAGEPVGRATSAITWGGVGTDAQHAVFQLLHQGTHLVPVEFLAVVEPDHAFTEEHHRQLLINCFAQGAALMAGKQADDPARSYSGDRPSTTLLLDRLDPSRLGALIAFYEHRTFVNAVLLGINPFDQFGVELGKEMAKAIDTPGALQFDPSTKALIERALGAVA
ncbi:MAG: Glucose-6-phosphate isomerase [uncultured Sphingosinicella sp.]|uniref:Glucose-6-phosphate isomerase n=1 Tax=uncultured Sphingosinicella sp. TaxID=478748 RepID=A0A6J4U7D3_9SPHN|nr:glucose-6-phosphate isomerase [uncultured Sphingosinicella sp.]CAA9540154.1 MAG: Glucose-6-phosphate isomerase [uncultured Sphingosinicella sp.]